MTQFAHAADESLFLLVNYHWQVLVSKVRELLRNTDEVEEVIQDAE